MKLNTVTGAGKTALFEKEWESESVWFYAKEKSLTPKVMQSFADIQTRPLAIAEGLTDILTTWSITLEKESPEQPSASFVSDFPPTAENLARLPVDFLTFILETIGEAWQGDEKKAAKLQSSSAV